MGGMAKAKRSFQKLPDALRKRGVELNQRGVATSDLADAIGTDRSTVRKWCAMESVPVKRAAVTKWAERTDDFDLLRDFVQWAHDARAALGLGPYEPGYLLAELIDTLGASVDPSEAHDAKLPFSVVADPVPAVKGEVAEGAEDEPEEAEEGPLPLAEYRAEALPIPAGKLQEPQLPSAKDTDFMTYLKALTDNNITMVERYEQVVSSAMLYKIEKLLAGRLPPVKNIADFERLVNILRKTLGLENKAVAAGASGRIQLDLNILTSRGGQVIDAQEVKTPKGRLSRNVIDAE